MTAIEYKHKDMVRELKKKGLDIQLSMTPDKADIWHGATGVATEAGELLDAVKKFAIYGKNLDIINVIEELGDIEFYLEMIRSHLHIEREEVLFVNIKKLRKRYGQKYSDEAAIARADKEVGMDPATQDRE